MNFLKPFGGIVFQWRDKNLRKKIDIHILLLEISVVFFTQPNYYILMKVYTYTFFFPCGIVCSDDLYTK